LHAKSFSREFTLTVTTGNPGVSPMVPWGVAARSGTDVLWCYNSSRAGSHSVFSQQRLNFLVFFQPCWAKDPTTLLPPPRSNRCRSWAARIRWKKLPSRPLYVTMLSKKERTSWDGKIVYFQKCNLLFYVPLVFMPAYRWNHFFKCQRFVVFRVFLPNRFESVSLIPGLLVRWISVDLAVAPHPHLSLGRDRMFASLRPHRPALAAQLAHRKLVAIFIAQTSQHLLLFWSSCRASLFVGS